MRTWLLVLLLMPLSGCVAAPFASASPLTMFGLEPIQPGDPAPVPSPNCRELRNTLNERALNQARVDLDLSVNGQYHWRWDTEMAVEDAASPRGAPAKLEADAQVTGTNNQEARVDEADLVKTDGEWTYVLGYNHLFLLRSRTVGDLEEVHRLPLTYAGGGQLLLERRDPGDPADDRLVVILPYQRADYPHRDPATGTFAPQTNGLTRILFLTLANRSAPGVEEEIWIEGANVGARLVDGTAYIIVHQPDADLGLRRYAHPNEADLSARGVSQDRFHGLSQETQRLVRADVARRADEANQAILAGVGLSDHLPTILVRRGDTLVRTPLTESSCRNVLTAPDGTGRGFTTILAASVTTPFVRTSTLQVAGSHPFLYMAEDALVLAAPSQDAWWFWAQPTLEEATSLHWFDLDGLDVSHRASGRVPGTVRDSFSLDVHKQSLRVATTTGTWGRWWVENPEPMMSHLAVFDAAAGQLVPRGLVGGIAPGERIWSARFTDDRAYLVTFRQIDPLWVIDLRGAPRILGELEIPGVSTYIHPLDDNTLLTIGLGPGRDGEGLDWGRLEVSLFDIGNPNAPRRADVLRVSPAGGHSWSGAVHEHKAFTYWDAVGTLAIPVSTYRSYEVQQDGRRTWLSDHHVGLRLVNVDRVRLDLSLRGEVDQDHLLDENQWGSPIERSYFLGYPQTGPVSVYAISKLGVTAHDLGTLELQDSVSFADRRSEANR